MLINWVLIIGNKMNSLPLHTDDMIHMRRTSMDIQPGQLYVLMFVYNDVAHLFLAPMS